MTILVAQTKTLTIAMFLIGLVCLVLGFFVVFLYRRKLKKNSQENFKIQEIQTKYKIFYFWGHIAYLLVIFSLLVLAIVCIAIGFGGLLE